MNTRFAIRLCSALAACAGLLAAPAQAAPAKAEPVVIAISAEFSVGGSTAAQDIEAGVNMAVEEINAAGGVLGGRPLVVETRDDRGVPMRAIDNLQELAGNPNVVALFCGRFSPVAIELAPIANAQGLLLLDPWAAADGITQSKQRPNYVFRLSLTDAWAMQKMLETARKRGYKRLAVYLPNTAWGRSSETALKTLSQRSPGVQWQTYWYQWGDTDFSRILSDLRLWKADAVLMVANEREGALILKGIAAFPKQSRPPILSHWGIAGGNFVALLGGPEALAEFDLSVVQTFAFKGLKTARATALARAYRARHKAEISDLAGQAGFAHAYDLTHLLAKAINRAGSTRRAAIRDALEQTGRHDGLVRRYHRPFSPSDHEALEPADAFIARFDNQGRLYRTPR